MFVVREGVGVQVSMFVRWWADQQTAVVVVCDSGLEKLLLWAVRELVDKCINYRLGKLCESKSKSKLVVCI